MTTVAISGIRKLDRSSEPDVELVMTGLVAARPAEIRFGGALGSDTVALRAAWNGRFDRFLGMSLPPPRLVVMVPFTTAQVPRVARDAIMAYADEVVSMGLPHQRYNGKRAFLDRNDRLLAGADKLVAFTDGSSTGGTAYTIKKARALKIHVEVVSVRRAVFA